jgi:hypothetical protein
MGKENICAKEIRTTPGRIVPSFGITVVAESKHNYWGCVATGTIRMPHKGAGGRAQGQIGRVGQGGLGPSWSSALGPNSFFSL